jgi:hypothetical protein
VYDRQGSRHVAGAGFGDRWCAWCCWHDRSHVAGAELGVYWCAWCCWHDRSHVAGAELGVYWCAWCCRPDRCNAPTTNSRNHRNCREPSRQPRLRRHHGVGADVLDLGDVCQLNHHGVGADVLDLGDVCQLNHHGVGADRHDYNGVLLMTVSITNLSAQFIGGERPEFRFEIRDTAGTLVTPTTIDAIVRDPTGTEVTYTGGAITNPSTGVYLFVHPALPNLPGTWHIKVVSTGTVTAHIARFEVATSPFST